MKKIFKTILKYYLKLLTKLAIIIHRPTIIAIAGSVNKSFFRDDLKSMLESKGFSVRATPKNFNTEIGLPLAILYLPSGYNEYFAWLPTIWRAPLAVFQKFPQILILELGVSDPGNMRYLLSIIKPDIAVITDITQRYLEAFGDMNELVKEYQQLTKKISTKGVIIYNMDNTRIIDLSLSVKCAKISFGLKNSADYQVINFANISDGITFIIQSKNGQKFYKINKFGEHHALSQAASQAIEDFYVSK
jgi:UDP-N-acetylmuramoyl-tripeptide--D-alanyl-D-alanine ligase